MSRWRGGYITTIWLIGLKLGMSVQSVKLLSTFAVLTTTRDHLSSISYLSFAKCSQKNRLSNISNNKYPRQPNPNPYRPRPQYLLFHPSWVQRELRLFLRLNPQQCPHGLLQSQAKYQLLNSYRQQDSPSLRHLSLRYHRKCRI